jgi:hypothetical protein
LEKDCGMLSIQGFEEDDEKNQLTMSNEKLAVNNEQIK